MNELADAMSGLEEKLLAYVENEEAVRKNDAVPYPLRINANHPNACEFTIPNFMFNMDVWPTGACKKCKVTIDRYWKMYMQ